MNRPAACVIFNPAARGEKARRFRNHLDEIGKQSILKLTTAPGDARRLAAEAALEGFETVVAAGGDGTVNEVLNGLADAPNGLSQSRLAVLPLGTVNVFARELEIPLHIRAAWECIVRGRESRIDLPSAKLNSGSGEVRCFAQLAGAGLDARAVELVAWKLKKRIGLYAYIVAGLQALAGPASRITVQSDKQTAKGGLVLIGNGRLYGGAFHVFPEADLRDGLLDVCVFPRVNWFTLARCGPRLLTRGRLPPSVVETFQARTVKLESPSCTAVQIDGELFGTLPVTFSVESCKLRVVVP